MMSGFKEDIVSILKHNNLFHREARGILVGQQDNLELKSLSDYLNNSGPLTSLFRIKSLRWDFIVIPKEKVSTRVLLLALGELNNMGVIIMEITGRDKKYENRYIGVSHINNIYATKVVYDDRAYIVFHPGGEYGN